MIDGLTNSSAIPALERLLQFSGQRHRLITNNIANLSTPGFQPTDVSVKDFQKALGKAVESRRHSDTAHHGKLELVSTSEVEFGRNGVTLSPQPVADNILFHDGNDRDVERTMQDLVENFMTFRATAQLLKNRYEAISTAIRERV